MRYSTNKDLDTLARDAVRNGWHIEFTGGGHLRWVTPCRKRHFFSSQTPSCQYVVHKVRVDMRKTLAAATAMLPKPKEQEKETAMLMTKDGKTLPTPNLTQKLVLPAQQKTSIFFQEAKRRCLAMMKEGKGQHDACTIVLTAFNVVTPIRPDNLWSHARLMKYVEAAYPKRAKREKKPEGLVLEEKPSLPSPEKTTKKKNHDENTIEETMQHVRAVLGLPFSKGKKQEIILDLLDELL